MLQTLRNNIPEIGFKSVKNRHHNWQASYLSFSHGAFLQGKIWDVCLIWGKRYSRFTGFRDLPLPRNLHEDPLQVRSNMVCFLSCSKHHSTRTLPPAPAGDIANHACLMPTQLILHTVLCVGFLLVNLLRFHLWFEHKHVQSPETSCLCLSSTLQFRLLLEKFKSVWNSHIHHLQWDLLRLNWNQLRLHLGPFN